MTIRTVHQIAQRSAVRSILFPKDGMAGGTDTALGAGIPACDAAEGLVAGGEGVASTGGTADAIAEYAGSGELDGATDM